MATAILILAAIGIVGLVPFLFQLARLRLSLGRQSQSVAIILFDAVLYTVTLLIGVGMLSFVRRILSLDQAPAAAVVVLALLFAAFPWVFLLRLRYWKADADFGEEERP